MRLSTARDLDVALAGVALDEPAPGWSADPVAPPRVVGAIVDLFARRYDGVAAVRAIAAARLPVLAVAEHDDAEVRRAALDAGALRVFSYNKLFTDGPRLIDVWLAPTGGRS